MAGGDTRGAQPHKGDGPVHRPLKWDATRLQVLDLIFEGRLSQEKVARSCTMALRTCKWLIAHPDFQAALQAKRDDLEASLSAVTYARKEHRVIALSQMAEDARKKYERRPWLRDFRPLGGGGRPERGERGGRGREKPPRDDMDTASLVAAASELLTGKPSEPEPPEGTENDAPEGVGDDLPGVPAIPPGDYAVSEHYNRDAYECFRGALDDIAKEMGHRRATADLPTSASLPPFQVTPPTGAPVDEDYEAGAASGAGDAAEDVPAHTVAPRESE